MSRKRMKKYAELVTLLVFAITVSLMSVQCAGTGGGGGDDDPKKTTKPGPAQCWDDPGDPSGRCNDPEDQDD